jgi:hypothetical protein
MDKTLQVHFQQRKIINNVRQDIKACWTTLATLYLDNTENTTALCNPGLEAFVNEPTTQFFEQGIVATFLCAQLQTNWIPESTIKIKDFYYYY